ncbi:MAG: flagellar hook-basal body protein [Oscillospiraceae bacterium]|nr:flagellar hook-basal body protein [Oscillospiraceae bacterium]
MFKGFYNLTSGMLTQQRNLNVVANNLVNVSTAGYKSDRYSSSTFDEVMLVRLGTKNKQDVEEIGGWSYIRASDQMYTIYDQGVPEPTGIALDFCIEGDGFFAVQQEDGQTVYTRSGSFSLDEEGYLCMPGRGRVLDPSGRIIYLGTDKIRGDDRGNIYSDSGLALGAGSNLGSYGLNYLGRVGVYTFEDNAALEHDQRGFFTGGGQATASDDARVHWGYLERANVDVVREMTDMLTSQRALQSCAQVSKMYDDVMSRAANDIGRMG